MGRTFNFYQWEGSGQGQYIAPFATLFTGFYFPQDLAQGGAVGFLWHLVDDDSLRLRPIRWAVRTSGKQVDGNNLFADISASISGNAFPSLTDSGTYECSFTGLQSGQAYDYHDLDHYTSGFNSGDNIDSPDFSGGWSGQQFAGLNDSYIYDFLFTGTPRADNIDISTWDFDFSGNFVGKDKDTASIDFILTQVIYNRGASTLSISTGDAASIDFVFASVTFRPN